MYIHVSDAYKKKLTVLSKNIGVAIIALFKILNNKQDLMKQ